MALPTPISGQELQAESYAVAQMNAIIHDMEVELARGDTMINPKFREANGKIRTHDIVVANPMWNQPFAPDLFANDPFDRFRTTGGITSGKGDWAWLQHTLSCLNEHGRAAVVLDTGAVNRADVMFVVNGIPVAIVEHKNPKDGDAIERAIKQLRRYEFETPELLAAPQLFNVTHLLDYWYGVTWNANRRDMARWKQAPEES
jgi:hypothetical protein